MYFQKRISIKFSQNNESFIVIDGTKYSRIDQIKFGRQPLKNLNFKLFKGCLPQISPGLFLNTLSQLLNFQPAFGKG